MVRELTYQTALGVQFRMGISVILGRQPEYSRVQFRRAGPAVVTSCEIVPYFPAVPYFFTRYPLPSPASHFTNCPLTWSRSTSLLPSFASGRHLSAAVRPSVRNVSCGGTVSVPA